MHGWDMREQAGTALGAATRRLVVLALLPDTLLRRLRLALEPGAAITPVHGLHGERGLAERLERSPPDLVVLDPADPRAAGAGPALGAVLARHRAVPVLLYCALSSRAVRAAAPLLRDGARDILIAGESDLPTQLRRQVTRLTADAAAAGVLAALAPRLRTLAPHLARAVDALFAAPRRFASVEDVACVAGVSRRHLARALAHAGLPPARALLVAARVLRASGLLDRRRDSLRRAAAALGVEPRILRRHIRSAVQVPSASALAALAPADVVARCATVLQQLASAPSRTAQALPRPLRKGPQQLP